MRLLFGPSLLASLLAAVPLAPHAAAQQGTKLLAGDPDTRDEFGISASCHGAWLAVGAYGDDQQANEAGAVYLFREQAGTWAQHAKLQAADASFGARFGASVCLQGPRLVVGAAEDSGAASRAGAAYVFERSGTVWTEVAKLTASDPTIGAEFGLSLSLSGDRIAVGAPRADGPAGTDEGAAYVFERIGGTWTETARLSAPLPAAFDRLGRCVAIDGDTVLVGAFGDDDQGGSAGTGYVYRHDGNDWTFEAQLLASDGSNGDQLGLAGALTGDIAVLGAWNDDDRGDNSGSAYVFTRSGSTWTEVDKLLANDGAAGDLFGISVAIDGDSIVVGALGNAGNATNAGSAYRFARRNSTDWIQQERLIAFDGTDGDAFGVVAIRGHTIVVGAHSDSDINPEMGSAYVFERPVNVGEVYCDAQPNSLGKVARIGAEGSDVVADADLTLNTVDLPPGAPGLYYFGPNQISVPFGDGVRCVGGLFRRMNPPLHAAGGSATRVFNWSASYATSVLAGSTRNFQLWYRDGAGGPAGFNFSEALAVPWR